MARACAGITLSDVDHRGNRQLISAANLAENDRVSTIFVEYPARRRPKIRSRVEIVNPHANLDFGTRLHNAPYPAMLERAMAINMQAFDRNCPQHVPQHFAVEQLDPHLKNSASGSIT